MTDLVTELRPGFSRLSQSYQERRMTTLADAGRGACLGTTVEPSTIPGSATGLRTAWRAVIPRC